jgi:hypothetical protein
MLLRRAIGGSLAAVLVWLASGPVLAQADQPRVQLILAKLPQDDSSAYKAIRRRAGDAVVEVLPLTKAQVWSIDRRKVAAARRAAVRYGAIAHRLEADWNAFRLEPPRKALRARVRALLAQAKSSKAAVGLVLTQTPRPAVFEYALTKDRGLNWPAKDAPKITVQLKDKTALTIARKSVTVKSDMLVWRGAVEGTAAPASIMWWPGVTMVGRIQHQGRIYAIRCIHGSMHYIVEMLDERMPPEHAQMPARLRVDDPRLRDDPLVAQGDASLLRSITASLRPPSAPRPPLEVAKPSPPSPAGEVVIDVIVAYTRKAAGNYSDVGRELVANAVEEANESFRFSSVGHVKLRLVHAYQTDYVEEGSHFDHVWRFADADDGYMEEIHALRDRYKADVALLIVDDPKGCGLATRVYADQDEAFAVVHHDCAALTYSLAHEIGHLIGTRHELNIDKTMTPFPYGHGYVNGTKWRDIMSYRESCGGCPRVPVWSSPKVWVEGDPAGTPDLDNARVIAEQAARVAAFR